MRVNIYAEELPTERRVERVETTADTGTTFRGVRIYLDSSKKLHDNPDDDDRSAVTFWGNTHEVARLLREAATAMDGNKI